MYLYTHTHTHTFVQTVTCMNVFKAEHLLLGNQLVCFPPRKTVFPTVSTPELARVVDVETPGLSPHPR